MQSAGSWPKRTHTCGALRAAHAGSTVVLNGWVNRRRDQGGLVFIDLRDRYGITQIVVSRDGSADAHQSVEAVRNEFVLAVTGEVRLRPAGTANPRLITGEIELAVQALEVLAASKPPPFEITSDAEVDESVRLRHRYLDLRRERLQRLTSLRFQISRSMREHLWERDFLELETPTLIRSTPEGARDFVVPSRLYPGEFYALPQSPQQLKQLLMVAGIDRYFQLARCYRDEDLRAARVAEHTQLDIEMAFVDRDDVLALIEELYLKLAREHSDKQVLQTPIPRMTYAEALDRFGTDKPDVRFGIELQDVSAIVGGRGFRVFDDVLQASGQVKALVAPGCAANSRKQVAGLQDVVEAEGAKGMLTIAFNEDGSLRSPLEKTFGPDGLADVGRDVGAGPGDLVCLIADQAAVVARSLGALRTHLAATLELADQNVLAFTWVTDFPLFEWDEQTERLTFSHNPFCSPADDSFELLYNEPSKALSKQYDLICNGLEIGGGSIRAHRAKDLRRIYEVMGYTEAETQDQIGHMLEAFEFGAPPHGGIAMGLDRITMLLGDTTNLRDVTVFPKNQAGRDLMLGAPSPLPDEQLAELNLRLRKTPASADRPSSA